MSIFGALINFLYPYLSYVLWHSLMKEPEIRMDKRSIACFLGVSFVVTLACMFLLAACGTIFFGRPFESKFFSYFGNNILWAMTAGTVIFSLAFEPAIRKGLVFGKDWSRRRSP